MLRTDPGGRAVLTATKSEISVFHPFVVYGYVLSMRFYLVVVGLRQAVSTSEVSHNFWVEETPEKTLE
jgi:hypothetical protein